MLSSNHGVVLHLEEISEIPKTDKTPAAQKSLIRKIAVIYSYNYVS